MTASQTEQAALAYLERGWSVVIVQPRGKRPIVRWQTFQKRLPRAEEVKGWLSHHPHANLAIVTGALSGLVVLDVDPRHGGLASLERWEHAHEALPPTVESQTGGGGRHLYFAHPGGEVRNRVGLAPGLDVRGDGGVIVAPPSIHPSGGAYRWIPGHAPDEIPVAPMPAWLRDLALSEPDASARSLRSWPDRVVERVDQGHRNDAIASFTGHLLWHGIDPGVARELMLCWNRSHCRPPLDDSEVIQIVESITRTHRRHHANA